jgi:hypothetical protein
MPRVYWTRIVPHCFTGTSGSSVIWIQDLWAFAISVVIAAWICLAVNVVYMIRVIAVLIGDHTRNRNQTGT